MYSLIGREQMILTEESGQEAITLATYATRVLHHRTFWKTSERRTLLFESVGLFAGSSWYLCLVGLVSHVGWVEA